jgi:hypothetical protein
MPEHPPEQHEGNQESRATPGADELESEAGFLIHDSLLSDRFRPMADSILDSLPHHSMQKCNIAGAA